VKLGLFIFPTESSIHPIRLAREAEARGFESLLFPEHTHIPASRRTPFPGGGDLPPHYWQTYDPFVALAQAAAVTERLRVGTGVCLVIEHDPIVLAKQVASLDSLSGGRFVLGIGAGWNAEEMENHGTRFGERWKLARERILAMKQIWTQTNAEYHGKYVSFDPIWSEPKPRQKPHPPVWIGASTRHALKRVVEYADGWLPIHGSCNLEQRIAELRLLAERARRDPASISISLFAAPGDRAKLEAVEKLGVERAILPLPSAPAEAVLPLLDRYAQLL
jgi:probable F420-dependent oxidoreductase